jgi:hypothetical protein
MLMETLEKMRENYNDSLFYTKNNETGQIVIISNVKKETVLEMCLKFLINKGFNKLIYNKLLSNGIYFKLEKMVGIANYFEVGIYQEEENVKIVMQFYDKIFQNPRQDSVMYLNFVKSIYRRLKRDMPNSTIEQLSNYPRLFRKL